MKKLNLLMLLTSVFLLFNCRTELTNEEKTDEASAFHSQNNKITFREFLKITRNNKDDLLNPKSGKNISLNEFDIDTSYILKRTEEANITKFSLLLKKKNETNKNIVYNMLYYRTKSGEWKYFIIKVEHTPNPNKLYGWKKTSLYKLQDGEASKGCSSSYQFGNIDWFQCSAGHGPDCSRNGGACCAGCHHSMAVSYWVNSCDQSAPGEFDINYGGGSGNPITMEDVKNAIKNNVSAETYQKFLSLSYNLQQGVISCFYNDYLATDLVSAIIDFFYTHPNTQNPDVIYYRLSDFIKSFTLNQQDWLKNNLNIALPLLDHYTINNNMQFSNWAVNFFIQNPNTSWTQFQNWFMGTSEGQDGEYVNNLDDVLNTLQYQIKQMPNYSNFVNAFPKQDYPGYPGYYKQLPASQVYPQVGGMLENLYNTNGQDTGPYRNACTVRFSLAMNRLGYYIPNNELSRKGAIVNGNQWYYYLQAKTAGDFMQKTFGNPTHKLEGSDANDPNKVAKFLEGKTGIYVIVNNNHKPTSQGGAGYTGHVDLIQNGHIPGGANAYNVPGGIKSIRIWEFTP